MKFESNKVWRLPCCNAWLAFLLLIFECLHFVVPSLPPLNCSMSEAQEQDLLDCCPQVIRVHELKGKLFLRLPTRSSSISHAWRPRARIIILLLRRPRKLLRLGRL